MSSNEIRQIVGMKPSNDPEADELRNKNLTDPNAKYKASNGEDKDSDVSKTKDEKGADQNG